MGVRVKTGPGERCYVVADRFIEGNSVVVAHHDSLTIERRFSRHSAEVQLLAVDTQSDMGAGRYVVSYDVDMTAIVWDLMTGEEAARFASYENLTCAAWMRNGNGAFGRLFGGGLPNRIVLISTFRQCAG
jgi:WD40 repeat protein